MGEDKIKKLLDSAVDNALIGQGTKVILKDARLVNYLRRCVEERAERDNFDKELIQFTTPVFQTAAVNGKRVL